MYMGQNTIAQENVNVWVVFFLSNSRITRIIEFITRLVIQNHEIEMKRLYINLLTDYSVGTMGTGYKISNRLVVYM